MYLLKMENTVSLYTQLDDFKKQKVDARISVLFRHHQRITNPFLATLFQIKREELAKSAMEGTI